MICGILNGILDAKLCQMVEFFSFREGFATYRLESNLQKLLMPVNEKSLILFLDMEGLKTMEETAVEALSATPLPVVLLVPGEEPLKIPQSILTNVKYRIYPLCYCDFKQIIYNIIEREVLSKRTLVFGRLKIYQENHRIQLDEKWMDFKGYEYDVFLMLLKNMGNVLSRDYINKILPDRKRKSERNIDTYIKSIRRTMGTYQVIQSVRSVGYGIDAEKLYQIMIP